MPTVRDIVTDAFVEIGVLEPGDPLPADKGALGLLRFQNQLDAWQANRLTLAVQTPTQFVLTSGTSTVTLGASGATVTVDRPLWIDTVAYVVPGSSPQVEVKIGQMDRDTYADLSIKQLPSALPTQCFYETSVTSILGSLFFWPQVTQNVTINLYHPRGVPVPTSLNSAVFGPPGYADAFMYDLAFRLCQPTGTAVPEALPTLRRAAMLVMQRPNAVPATVGIDPAATGGGSSGYNILSDIMEGQR
jgi:hypothetical protein